MRVSDLHTWGAPKWPPIPPNLRSAPAEPWHSSIYVLILSAYFANNFVISSCANNGIGS